jgi:hypothetical protein
MAEYLQASAPERKPAKPKYSHMEIHNADNGGHIVKHIFAGGDTLKEPEEYAFSDEDGDKALAHIAKHAKIKGAEEELGEEEHKGEPLEGKEERSEKSREKSSASAKTEKKSEGKTKEEED